MCGNIDIAVPFSNDFVVSESVDIASAGVPFLVGHDLLNKHKIYANNISNNCYSKIYASRSSNKN